IAKLQQVLKDAPNNLSAKYLLMHATGKVPLTLSLAGSLDAIDNAAGELVSSIKSNKGQSSSSFAGVGKASVGSNITRLQTLRARCDLRTRAYADAIIRFGNAVKEAQDRPPGSAARAQVLINAINGSAQMVQTELDRLLGDPKVREELDS
ncbi:MAG: hypothetical protein ACAH88_16580, partial [Roseimicrobium sp.]